MCPNTGSSASAEPGSRGHRSAIRVAGVDATGGGWVAIVLEDGRFAQDLVLRPVETDFAELAGVQVIAIDIPIGFGPRAADRLARGCLKGSGSSVFGIPAEASFRGPFGPGLGISAQAHALGPRIRHVTGLARADVPGRFREVHPEVSFRAMNEGRPLAGTKRSAAGSLQRIDLLRQEGIDLAGLTGAAPQPLHDVLDAAAAAWTAHRVACGTATCLPDPPETLEGLPVAIWY